MFVFRERVIYLWTCFSEMNLLFVVVFMCAMFTARNAVWTSRQLMVLAWFTCLLLAFVACEYVYRAGTLVFTKGRDCFTCLTPSRMATDLVYPMSIMCGFLPLSPLWQKYSRICVSIFVVVAATSVVAFRHEYRYVGIDSFDRDAATWLRSNSPENAMIVGSFPHLEYLSWRESAYPPLPASEARNAPHLKWKRELPAPRWLAWERSTQRPVYYVFDATHAKPGVLKKVHQNSKWTIMVRQEG